MIRISDVTTNRTVDVNLEEGGMESVQCLMEQARGVLGASQILRLVIGDLSIPQHEWEQQSVDTYLLLGLEFPGLRPQDRVRDLRDMIYEKTGVPQDQMTLICAGKTLSDDDKTLGDYIQNSCPFINMVLRMPGGGSLAMGLGMPFVNVDEDSLPTRSEWNTQPVPRWRTTVRGLCIEGNCSNPVCESKGSLVIVKFGYVTLNLVKDVHKCQCPVCGLHVEPVTCGFNNCYWSLVGEKRSNTSQPVTSIKIKDKYADDAWHWYNPNEKGTTQWVRLVITATREKSCGKCSNPINKVAESKLSCGHSYHRHCVTKADECSRCEVSVSMTSYQRSQSAV